MNLWKQYWNKYCAQVPSENRTLMSFRNYVALGKTQISENSNGITLLTAHMSKGLQYEVVFVIGLSEGTFPDYRAVKEGGESLMQEKTICMLLLLELKGCVTCHIPNGKRCLGGTLNIKVLRNFLVLLRINSGVGVIMG